MTGPAVTDPVRACLHALVLLNARATWGSATRAGALDLALGVRWLPWGTAGPACPIAPALADAVLGAVRRHGDAIKRALAPGALADALPVPLPAGLRAPAACVTVAELAAVRLALDAAGRAEYQAHHDAHAARGAPPWLAAAFALDDCAQPARAELRARLRARAGLADRPP